MFVRNTDTGKWINQIDSLSKDNYDNLKQDLEKTRLYSKCLSGSTYISISNFDNIYETFDIQKIGFYIDPNTPLYGDRFLLNSTNSFEYYNKYLKENAFSIKNLFTPNKLIEDQHKNHLLVDVATIFPIEDLGQVNTNYTIDGVRLLNGHRVLVKNQTSIIELANSVDPEVYFSTTELVAEYFIDTDNVTSKTYFWYNEENGIYEYINNRLIKTTDLDEYENAYKYSIVVKLGVENVAKQYHLARLRNGYYPLSSQNENCQFNERKNWIMRNRVDYNNIFDLNYYDILIHSTQSAYYEIEGRTYSIPPRVLVVGEFGIIINNQDQLFATASYNQSHIMPNKFKNNLRSIVEVTNYYWICGDEGLLIKVKKSDFTIERINLGETSNFTSISFFGDLYGKVVGEFNTIYWTKDGGLNWNKTEIQELDKYSYTKVIYYGLNKTYVSGKNGIFIEFTFINGEWVSYKRKISKVLSPIDEYVLVEDINDMAKTEWVKIIPNNLTKNSSSIDFGENLIYINTESNAFGLSYTIDLNIEISSIYFGLQTFSSSQFFGAIEVEDADGNIIYSNPNYNSPFVTIPTYPAFQTWDFYLSTFTPVPIGTNMFKKSISVSLPQTNNILNNTTFKINVKLYYNYDALTDSVLVGFTSTNYSYFIDTIQGDLLVLACNNSTVICYDVDNLISKSNNQFIYCASTQSLSDVRSITIDNGFVFPVGDKIYGFQVGEFTVNGTQSNEAQCITNIFFDKYVNKLAFNNQTLLPHVIGNNSLNQFYSGTFFDLDPTLNSRLKSRFLYLDYDVASKLNFFTDEGEYRLPTSVTFTQSLFTQSFIVTNTVGQTNWINYYKDAEKTFKYYSSISNPDKVEFSTTFSYVGAVSAFESTFDSSLITSSLASILPLAPSIESKTFSKFIDQQPNLPDIANQYDTRFRLLLNRYLLIFKITLRQSTLISGMGPNVGEVLRLTSDVIDCNLVINRIEAYKYLFSTTNPTKTRMSNYPLGLTTREVADVYCYCYSNFNDNIIKNIQKPNTQVTITNLNKYSSVDRLLEHFELHPVSIGYKLEKSDNTLELSPRFNNKTSYYNLAATATIGAESKNLVYLDSFLNFGYTPTYNLLEYLEKITPRFNPNYKFTVMPEFYNVPGDFGNGLTDNNVFIDLTIGLSSPTASYRTGTNQILFGKNLKFNWDALFLHTFIDLTLVGENQNFPGTPLTYTTERMLITNKFYRSDVDAYVIEFHKKIEIDDSVANDFNIYYINTLSRNTLSLISQDLQLLNNIQRSSRERTIEYPLTFTNLENEIFTKFPTDSYFKILASDYNIREYISAIIYTDSEYQIAMNLFNVEEEKKYEISYTTAFTPPGFGPKLRIFISGEHELQVGDLVKLEFTGGQGSSETENPSYFGLHTVIDSFSSPGFSFIIIQVDFNINPFTAYDPGTVTFIKKDPFFNYVPIDLFDLGSDKKVSRAIEIKPENYVLSLDKYSLVNVDFNNFRYILIDGLSLEELNRNFGWVLEAEISDAIIGRDKDGGLIWYSGIWHCGRWFGGTWYSGRWVSGDWYRGTWNSNKTTFRIITVNVDDSYIDNTASRWFNGRWFEGTWNGGTWYDGRRYSGDWNTGLWYKGIWNDGNWNDGRFEGGVWVLGTWNAGVFNCESNPAYFLDGVFRSGDFENGIWYNGQFGNERGLSTRFGTKSSNTRTSLWHAGRWIDGEFHSFLNTNSSTGLPDVSDIHKYSIWRTGVWLRGNFYGGIAYNIDFKAGTWHGGILEEIQVIGVDAILPSNSSSNSITLNGIFKFNPGDSIWMIDDYRNGAFSPLGNNDLPRKYRINQILEDSVTEQTKLFLNFNLSTLGVDTTISSQTYSNVETGLRVVSYFKDSYWKSGLWTNGIFFGGQFDSGIWYNGVFDGTWGN